MVNEVSVNPDQLRAAAELSAGIEQRIDYTMQRLQTSLIAAGTAWGKDGFGDKFATGYLPARENLTKGAETMAKTFGAIADGQVKAAAHLDGQEHYNTKVFGLSA
ncbi:hypothetical protein [Nocardia altamirensis]|uniref:hypothetical protein n=1 Tax=Nocardia altamirensis TaxID=472158 RepID=UPI0008403942|nr:hypothetical protein [Nocardia altamirensis]